VAGRESTAALHWRNTALSAVKSAKAREISALGRWGSRLGATQPATWGPHRSVPPSLPTRTPTG
jgi:hypothetical protein